MGQVSRRVPACAPWWQAYVIPQPMAASCSGPGASRVEIPFPWHTPRQCGFLIKLRYACSLQTTVGGSDAREWTRDGWIVRRPNGTYTGTMLGTI